jgi:hypothetical protein
MSVSWRDEAMVHMYLDGQHPWSIARVNGVHPNTVWAVLRRYGVELREQPVREKKYGLAGEAREQLIARPCGICGTVDRERVVDHCHATGQVRGALCGTCNTGLGKMGDSLEGLQRAVAYLSGSQGGHTFSEALSLARDCA